MKKFLLLLSSLASAVLVTASCPTKITLIGKKFVDCKCVNGKAILKFFGTNHDEACQKCHNACCSRGGVESCSISKK